MSVSQYKNFLKCPAAALAKLKGDWQPLSDPIALLVGNYVHSYFEDLTVHEKFKEENKNRMFSSRKPYGLLKDFKIAEQMIDRLIVEDAFLNLYQGEKEVIVTGELFGVEWKGKIDCLNLEDDYLVGHYPTLEMAMRGVQKHYTLGGGTEIKTIEDYRTALAEVQEAFQIELKLEENKND